MGMRADMPITSDGPPLAGLWRASSFPATDRLHGHCRLARIRPAPDEACRDRRLDHATRLAHHRVAAVVVRQAEDPPAGQRSRMQPFGLINGVGHRLVANHVESCGQRGARQFEVAVIRGHDRDHLGTVGTYLLSPDQVETRDIGPLRRPSSTPARRRDRTIAPPRRFS